MPVYTYACDPCRVSVDRKKPIDERDDLPPCPACATAMPRRIHPQRVNLHGSQSDDPITKFQFAHLFKD